MLSRKNSGAYHKTVYLSCVAVEVGIESKGVVQIHYCNTANITNTQNKGGPDKLLEKEANRI